MIRIVAHTLTPRLQYACELIFSRILGVEYAINILSEHSFKENEALLSYLREPIADTFGIPVCGLIDLSEVVPIDPRGTEEDVPLLFPVEAGDGDFDLPFDIFSATFFLATEYEKTADPKYDQHDRYDAPQYLHHQNKWYEKPLIHLYAEMLWENLKNFYPQLSKTQRKSCEFDYEITLDIDWPWKYKNKGFIVQVGGFFKDLIQGRWDQLQERISTFLSGRDPYYTFELIFQHFPVEKTLFFHLIERHSSFDSRFTHRTPALRKLIREIRDRGYEQGVHPSYTSFQEPDKLKSEAEILGRLIKRPITCSRQHFLRYRLPETFRTLIDLGIRDEYSLCAFHTGGFPTGLAIPYPWYDLGNESISPLILHPTLMMDRTIERYMKLEPESAYTQVSRWITATRKVNGVFCLLLHNDCLSESGEWKGWRKPVLAIVESLTNAKN